jgi:hypothetical protein
VKKNDVHSFLALFSLFSALACPVSAMEVSLQGGTIMMSGAVVQGDLDKLKTISAANPEIKTVVLKNSFGGHVDSGYQVGEWIREQGMRTVVVGYCISSCSRMFLGGVSRQFAQDSSTEPSHIGFHGHYDSSGSVNAALVEKKGLHAWIMKYTDGRADSELVAKWVAFRRNTDVVNFFHPETKFSDNLSVRNCERYTRTNGAPLRCPGISNTDALKQGIITTLDRFTIAQ